DFEGRRIPNVQARGSSAGWPAYTQGDFLAGRDFTPAEVRESRPVVVLSDALAQDLFGVRDPIGQRVALVNEQRGLRGAFTVLGVFEPKANIFTSVVKDWVILPYSASLKRLKAEDNQAQILVVPRESVPLEQVKDEAISSLR